MTSGKIVLVTLLAGALGFGFAVVSRHWLGADWGLIPTHLFSGDSSPDRLDRLPGFRLPDVHGEEIDSNRWAGKVLVLNFWATWCPPCRRELPLFDELQRTRRDEALQVVGIAIDDKEDVQAFLKEHPVGFPILIGGMDAIEMSRQLGNQMQGLPFTAIFDGQGKGVYTHAGEMTRDTLSEHVEPLLSQPALTKASVN
jgi:thiol-disulfide isomerase/thioredoxin